MSSFMLLCGGQGKRFDSVTPYRKPTMPIYGRPMYQWVLETLLTHINNLHVVIQGDSIGNSILDNIEKQYPGCPISSTKLDYFTRGPAETCMLSISQLSDKPFWVVDNDILYDPKIPWDTLQSDSIGIVVQEGNVTSPHSPYSHVNINKDNLVDNIVEKKNIGKYIVLGAYGFGSPQIYRDCFEHFKKSNLTGMEWYMSSIIKSAISMGIKVVPIYSQTSRSIGTPEQLYDAISLNLITPKPLRWVFSLDETLSAKEIGFIKHLHANGHYIILHTSVHNASAITQNNIPYHELLSNKPQADIFVDNKSTNPYHWEENWMTGSLGFGWNPPSSYSTKKITVVSHDICYKLATYDEAMGNKYFIDHCPSEIKSHIPKLYDTKPQNDAHIKLIMEWKSDCITVSNLYNSSMLDETVFQHVLNLMQIMHACNADINTTSDELSQNYFPKFKKRYDEYQQYYTILSININLMHDFFSSYIPTLTSCIHGDYWFGNLLWCHKQQKMYMIDMRGRIGNKLSINGDKYYDYAKLLQSIYGFDYLVHTGNYQTPSEVFLGMFIEHFSITPKQLQDIKKITALLILGSVPFHENVCTNLNNVKRMVQGLWPELFI